MLSRNEFQKYLERMAEEAKCPYGMFVEIYTINKGYRGDNYDVKKLDELKKKCQRFYANDDWHLAITKIVISERKNRPDQTKISLPRHGAEHVLRAMEKNDFLVEVSVPKSFFNQNQKARLKTLLEKNHHAAVKRNEAAKHREDTKKRLITQYEFKQHSQWSVLAGLTSLLLPFALGISFSSLLIISPLSLSMGYGLSAVRQWYLNRQASQYDSICHSGSLVKESMNAGENATDWLGYAKSYLISATYLEPCSFAAAMQRAIHHKVENNDQTACKPTP